MIRGQMLKCELVYEIFNQDEWGFNNIGINVKVKDFKKEERNTIIKYYYIQIDEALKMISFDQEYSLKRKNERIIPSRYMAI